MSLPRFFSILLCLSALVLLAAGCPKPPPEDVTPRSPEVEPAERPAPAPAPVERVEDAADDFAPADEAAEDVADLSSLEKINQAGLLRTVYFAFDRYDLSESTRRTLKDNATTLQAHPSWRVRLDGHCDERGTIEYNLELGAKRAGAVREYLIGLGIPPARIETRSFGEERPVDPGHDESAWSKNRRAEFVVVAM